MAYFTASCDDEETNEKFAEELELDYPILSDPDCETASEYGISNGKRSGRATFFIGKDGKILHIENSVNMKAHGSQIADTLKELGVDEK